MGLKDKDNEPELDPEVEARLKAIRERDIEKLAEDHMAKCLHVDLNFGLFRLYFNPLTSIASAMIIWAFVIYCVVEKEDANDNLKEVKTWITDRWTWLYVGTQDVWAIFIVWLYFSKYSNLKLGREDEKPEFADGSYFTMLFSAGIGIGLFYYGVAEPVLHYTGENRYSGRYSDNQKAQDAMNLTYFHWGIHGWVVYVIIGLLLGFLSYRRGLPMTMRTCFYPILGHRVFGILGDLIDILCIICTMFGVCTSLGLGVIQLNNGLHRLNNDIAENTDVQTAIIWCVTALATISVISGVKLGIRRLSEICFGIGCFLMFVVLFADDTWYILNLFTQSVGYYFQWIIQLGFHTDAFAQLGIAPDNKEQKDWMDGWTIFYWGWWISWSPFVGMFIAKISRGRTIKDFILYTLTLPCFYSFFWMAIFGGVGIRMENIAINKGITCAMYNSTVTALNTDKYDTLQEQVFGMYGVTRLSCRKTEDMWFDVMNAYGDIGTFLSVVSLIAIILYFVTSSDSGSLVIDCLSANGNPEPPVLQRIFWALTEGATATALLVAGGTSSLNALQAVSVACGLPFTFCLNWTCVAIYRALREEAGEIGEFDRRWKYSMWDVNSVRRLSKVVISLFFPWYYLGLTRMKLDNRNSIVYQAIVSLCYAIPFYLWIILMIVEVEVDKVSYVAWGILMFFFAFAGGMRGEIREIYDVEGNMVEDFFALVLVHPLSIMQMHEQVTYGTLPVEKEELGMVDMNGTAKKYFPNEENGVHIVSHNSHAQ